MDLVTVKLEVKHVLAVVWTTLSLQGINANQCNILPSEKTSGVSVTVV